MHTNHPNRQIFPSSIEGRRLSSKNSALARIHQKRAEMKADAATIAHAVDASGGED